MKKRNFAKYLRQQDVPAEDLLWQHLRNRQCGGYKFVRQHPIGKYIVDFACRQKRVAVEIDGMTHIGREEYDRQRENDLRFFGYEIIRFTNDDVYEDVGATVDAIFHYLETISGRDPLSISDKVDDQGMLT